MSTWKWISDPNASVSIGKKGPAIINTKITPTLYSAKLEWTTDAPTTSKLFLDSPSGKQAFPSAFGLSTNHSVNLTSLLPNSTYTAEIEVIDGNNQFEKRPVTIKTVVPTQFASLEVPVAQMSLLRTVGSDTTTATVTGKISITNDGEDPVIWKGFALNASKDDAIIINRLRIPGLVDREITNLPEVIEFAPVTLGSGGKQEWTFTLTASHPKYNEPYKTTFQFSFEKTGDGLMGQYTGQTNIQGYPAFSEYLSF